MANVKRALEIEGWMEPPELAWLAEQATKHSLIVEIGSFKGRSTRALADNTKGVVIAIDDFYGPREIHLDGRPDILGQFTANLADLSNVVVINENHRQLSKPDFTPDMVFLDGGHEYENVLADIDFWIPFIAPGGLLCGHDYGWCEGVKQAVHERFPNFQLGERTSIWYQQL